MRIAIAVVEQAVCGIPAYHAQCLTCGWRCHRSDHPAEGTAIRCAERHACK